MEPAHPLKPAHLRFGPPSFTLVPLVPRLLFQYTLEPISMTGRSRGHPRDRLYPSFTWAITRAQHSVGLTQYTFESRNVNPVLRAGRRPLQDSTASGFGCFLFCHCKSYY